MERNGTERNGTERHKKNEYSFSLFYKKGKIGETKRKMDSSSSKIKSDESYFKFILIFVQIISFIHFMFIFMRSTNPQEIRTERENSVILELKSQKIHILYSNNFLDTILLTNNFIKGKFKNIVMTGFYINDQNILSLWQLNYYAEKYLNSCVNILDSHPNISIVVLKE